MSWTPYVGDPYEQVGEAEPSHYGTTGKSLGGRAAQAPIHSRQMRMNSGQRLQTAMAPGVGVQRFTPDQLFFRDSIADGRWGGRVACGPGEIANKHINMIRRHADGTCDIMALEADGKFYLDLGGRGARDVAVGKA